MVFEWTEIIKNISRDYSNIFISENSSLKWDINLKSGKIIFKDNSSFTWNIILKEWSITIWKNVTINWNIDFNWKIIIWENSKINWDVNSFSELNKHSTVNITWKKPSLYKTINYPEFLEFFDSLPDSHKKEFWYIFLISSNMDIRWKDILPSEYFKWIYVYRNKKTYKFKTRIYKK